MCIDVIVVAEAWEMPERDGSSHHKAWWNIWDSTATTKQQNYPENEYKMKDLINVVGDISPYGVLFHRQTSKRVFLPVCLEGFHSGMSLPGSKETNLETLMICISFKISCQLLFHKVPTLLSFSGHRAIWMQLILDFSIFTQAPMLGETQPMQCGCWRFRQKPGVLEYNVFMFCHKKHLFKFFQTSQVKVTPRFVSFLMRSWGKSVRWKAWKRLILVFRPVLIHEVLKVSGFYYKKERQPSVWVLEVVFLQSAKGHVRHIFSNWAGWDELLELKADH